MNDITYQSTNRTLEPVDQAHFLTRELERLWLLSALRVGLDQAERGETVLANEANFDAMQSRLFGTKAGNQERVIEA